MKCLFQAENRANKVINEITSCISIAMRNLTGKKNGCVRRQQIAPPSLSKQERISTVEVTPLVRVEGKKDMLGLVGIGWVSRSIGSELVLHSAWRSARDGFKDSYKTREIFADTAACQQAAGLQGTRSMGLQLFAKTIE